MRVDERVVLDVVDLTTLRFECKSDKCGTTVAIPVASYGQPPLHCPSCHTEWFPARSTMATDRDKQREFVVQQLVQGVRALHQMASDTDTPFRVRLELPATRTERAGK